MTRAAPVAPYALVAVGLFGGLAVVLGRPFAAPRANLAVGGVLLAVATGAVLLLVVAGSAPGERGPDF